MQKIRRDDEIIVIAGKDKGKRGKVLKVLADDRLVVGGVNLVKRHTKPNPMAGVPGGIIEKEAPLHVSNIAIFNGETNKADRVGFKVEEGKKIRVFKSTQKAVVTYARKSIAGFKVREGWPIGVKVTLRRDRMYEFLDRLLAISLPRVRDFRGLNAKSFDGRGNYSMGVKEQIIFPEIDYDKIDALRGLDITLTTTARNDDEGRALLRAFNFPFRN